MKKIIITFFIYFLIIHPAIAFDPGQKDERVKASAKPQQSDDNFAIGPVKLYQRHLSRVIGGNCPMYPSCSKYCVDAIKKHGAVMGWIMACDRLMRCGRDELNQSKPIRFKQHTRCYDPVSKNDFWLK